MLLVLTVTAGCTGEAAGGRRSGNGAVVVQRPDGAIVLSPLHPGGEAQTVLGAAPSAPTCPQADPRPTFWSARHAASWPALGHACAPEQDDAAGRPGLTS